MKKLMMFEGYIDNKIKSLKKVKKIVDFIEKYKLKYFVIAMEMEDDDYMFEDIREENGVYKLEYVDYNGVKNYNDARGKLVDLIDLPINVVDSLYRCCDEYGRFTVEFHLEMGQPDIETITNILKKHKEKIEFNDYMFSMMLENEFDISTFKFQDMLFTTHPESYKAIINEYFDGLSRSDDGKGYGLEINPKILKKYDKLLGEYYRDKLVEYESKKYNL